MINTEQAVLPTQSTINMQCCIPSCVIVFPCVFPEHFPKELKCYFHCLYYNNHSDRNLLFYSMQSGCASNAGDYDTAQRYGRVASYCALTSVVIYMAGAVIIIIMAIVFFVTVISK